jgi:hypothetical protein
MIRLDTKRWIYLCVFALLLYVPSLMLRISFSLCLGLFVFQTTLLYGIARQWEARLDRLQPRKSKQLCFDVTYDNRLWDRDLDA